VAVLPRPALGAPPVQKSCRGIEDSRCVWKAAFARDCVGMSQENVEIVRHLYESGLFDRDPEDLLKLATSDVEYVNPPYAVEPGVRRGLVEVAQAMRRFAEVWDESRHELRELYDCGDAVVAAVNWHIHGRGSERELVNKEAHTWTLREGRIARFEWGQDLDSALEAAGFRG
jgi:ketosteroid isomerase-like protein